MILSDYIFYIILSDCLVRTNESAQIMNMNFVLVKWLNLSQQAACCSKISCCPCCLDQSCSSFMFEIQLFSLNQRMFGMCSMALPNPNAKTRHLVVTKRQWSHSYSAIALFSSLYFLDLRCPPPEPQRRSDFFCGSVCRISTFESNQHFQRFCDLKIQTGAAIEHVGQCRVHLLGMCLASTKVDGKIETPISSTSGIRPPTMSPLWELESHKPGRTCVDRAHWLWNEQREAQFVQMA